MPKRRFHRVELEVVERDADTDRHSSIRRTAAEPPKFEIWRSRLPLTGKMRKQQSGLDGEPPTGLLVEVRPTVWMSAS